MLTSPFAKEKDMIAAAFAIDGAPSNVAAFV